MRSSVKLMMKFVPKKEKINSLRVKLDTEISGGRGTGRGKGPIAQKFGK